MLTCEAASPTQRSGEDAPTEPAAPSPVYSKRTPWSLASLALSCLSLLALAAWLRSLSLPAGRQIVASSPLMLSVLFAVGALLAVVLATRQREGTGVIVSAIACVLAALPSLFFVWLNAVFTYQ